MPSTHRGADPSRARTRRSAGDLGLVLAMSSELAQTMDSRQVGDLIARHIARATGSDECAISYWDREQSLVATYGYYPPERRAAIEETYSLADYPETRRVLEQQTHLVVDVDDPAADPSEVAYLRSIGNAVSAMLPLVAKGQTIGLVELNSGRHMVFDPARLLLAQSMANEAAMALENARLYEQLRHQALHDPLTGLANRALFRDRVGHALARTAREDSQVGVLFLDLDDFKTVNDGLGHAAGDQLLSRVAGRLLEAVRPGDTVARLGGDEFAVLLEMVPGPQEALAVAERVLEALSPPLEIGGVVCQPRGSVGIAVGSGSTHQIEDLLANADFAMYQAKSMGKGRSQLFEPAMRDVAINRVAITSELRRAFERHEFAVFYQPIHDLRSRSVVGVEALVRWDHPTRGLLLPDQFIGIAEESGLIVSIGRWVLEQACRQVRAWQIELGRPELLLNVNVSPRQLQQTSIVEDVRRSLQRSGLPPGTLTLEITESLLVRDETAVHLRLGELKALGVRIAIDDFGTGYSSLSYLQRFPIDVLKIDRAFIEGLGRGEEAQALVRSILDIARTLKLESIAEGVERADQRPVLEALDVSLAQGFLFDRPYSAEETGMLLRGDSAAA
ncbi:MAG TPA: EAL domain-containing protein [Candidatus Limnocylindrales bacterium]|nr:EAL domain-containing protein [Candidatus Limnocylindrales bacterium]